MGARVGASPAPGPGSPGAGRDGGGGAQGRWVWIAPRAPGLSSDCRALAGTAGRHAAAEAQNALLFASQSVRCRLV